MAFYSSFLGWGIFWVSLIVGIILFIKFKKMYTIFYLVSVAVYIFTAGFIIEVFSLDKFGILITLVLSAVLFMVLGYYFSVVFKKSQSK